MRMPAAGCWGPGRGLYWKYWEELDVGNNGRNGQNGHSGSNGHGSGSTKTFVIDTNVFIHKPDCILSFRDNEVVVPLWVLEELDKLKTYSDERGRNARHAIRFLDEQSRKGNLSEGVKMENGSTLRVVMTSPKDVTVDLAVDKNDNKIIFTAYALARQGKTVFFVSKDINARVKATALGIKAVDYEKQKVNIEKLYSGYTEQDATAENVATLENEHHLKWSDTGPPNHYFLLHDRVHDTTALGRYVDATSSLEYVDHRMPSVAAFGP